MGEQRRTADAVMPSEFLCLPATSEQSGLSGYYLSPHVGAWKHTLPLDHFVQRRVGHEVLAGGRRGEGEQYLDAWSEAEQRRLGFGCPARQEARQRRAPLAGC